MDEGRGLQGQVGWLVGHLLDGQPAKPVVDQGQQSLGRLRIALLDRGQQPGDRVHRPGSTNRTERPPPQVRLCRIDG